jgi:two-component system CheB/CheR fusion protein
MQVLRTASVERYVARLRRDEEERLDLFRELLIGATAFFRDPEAFEALAEHVIENVFQRSNRTDPIRIWVPGCANGEEAYTIAMLCREKMDELDDPPEVQIFATDIDEQALNIARQGMYSAGIAEDLPPERLKRFFVKRSRRYHIAKEIRELCLFSVHCFIMRCGRAVFYFSARRKTFRRIANCSVR